MTQPIQEPSTDRALQSFAYQRDQIFRRPPPKGVLCGKFEGIIWPSTMTVEAGDDANGWFLVIPEDLDNFYLDHAEAGVYTASSSGDITAVVRNVTAAVDMATIVIDQGDNTSYQTGGSSTITPANAQVDTSDILVVDVDGAGTGAEGLVIILHFCLLSENNPSS